MYDFLDDVVSFLKILGDETRLKILNLLKNQEMTAKEIEERLGKSQSTISQHLKGLLEARLVEKIDPDDSNKKAKKYTVKDPNIIKLLENIKAFIISQKKSQLEKVNDINRLDTIF